MEKRKVLFAHVRRWACLALLASTTAAAQLTEIAAAGAGQQDDVLSFITPAAKRHFATARRAAGQDFPGPLQLCNQARPSAMKWPLPSPADLRGTGPTETDLLRMKKSRAQYVADGGVFRAAPAPARLFDNFYYVGIENVSAWAVDTSAGIIIIDALNNRRDRIDRIEPRMRRIGLDPARFRQVLLTHGHGDHFGGAAYLKSRYGAQVWMSAADWELAPHMLDKPYFDAPPPRDHIFKDGQRLTLGEETISIHFTPGHTQGTVSMFIPVMDKGRTHVALLWGGTGFNFPHTPARFEQYARSAEAFRLLARTHKADIALSPHPDFDDVVGKIHALEARRPGDAHPFIRGEAAVQHYLTIPAECARAYAAQLKPKL